MYIHMADRNLNVRVTCEICSLRFHPWRGREQLSRVCSQRCGGRLSSKTHAYQAEDFDRFVRRRENACWLWTGPSKATGYGIFSIRGRRVRAHRWAYERTHGTIPLGMYICHHCDNRLCVNPAHLYAGTATDNARDMAARGRAHKGPSVHSEAHPLSKLTTAKARAIRDDTRAISIIAYHYKVSKSLIRGIKAGTHWKYA